MNKNIFNYYLKEINSYKELIEEQKQIIKEIYEKNISKLHRNKNKFEEILNIAKAKEDKIKSLMDNKYFTYIQFVDFVNNNNINFLHGFETNKNGCLVQTPKNRVSNLPLEKILKSDSKEIIYKFNEQQITNEIEYSFYDKRGVPIIPEQILIHYDSYEDTLYEPYFRYYNRFTTNSFINSFLFLPKRIKSIKLIFNREINPENDYICLFSNEYETKKDKSYAILTFSNNDSLELFNLYKNTNEIIPLNFFLTENNIDFEELKFINNESVFKLKNKNMFSIKIESDYTRFKPKEEFTSQEIMLAKNDFVNSQNETHFKIDLNGIIQNADISLPVSVYNQLNEQIEALGLKSEDFFEELNGVYHLKKDLISYITEDSADIKKLRIFDDISILKTNKSAFVIYINIKTNTIYFPSFLSKHNLFFNFIIKTTTGQIDAKYYTPMLFDLSVKG